MKRKALIVLLFLLFVSFHSLCQTKPAPDFTLSSTEGAKITLSKLKGKVVLLVFFAEWCAPCKEEVPELNALQEKYAGFFKVLGIPYGETEKNKVQKLAKTFGVRYTVLLDAQGLVAKGYGITGLPHSVLISSQGAVLKVYEGISEKEKKELQNAIEKEVKLLKAGAGKIMLSLGQFKNITSKAKNEELAEKVKEKIAYYLSGKKDIVVTEGARYEISGSVSKFTEAFGVEVTLKESGTGKVLGKFSCAIENNDYAPLYDRLKALLQEAEPSCCQWGEK